MDRPLIARICSHFDSGFDVASDVDIDSKFAAPFDSTKTIFRNYIFGSKDEGHLPFALSTTSGI